MYPLPLPRADVSNAALAAALVGMALLLTTGTPTTAAIGAFATVISQAGLAYLLPAPYKIHANFLGGVIVAVGLGIYSVIAGLPYDEAMLQQNLVALVLFALNILLPARQP